MRSFVFIVLALGIALCANGCSRKEQPLEEMQQPMAPEDLSRLANSAQMQPPEAVPAQGPQMQAQAPAAVLPARPAAQAGLPEMKLEQLPPSGPYKPTAQEIQTALKNAGYDIGLVDGKIGPKTKKAIEDFQSANGLKADGKVGPKTWSLLSKHLNPTAESPAPQQ